MHFLWEILREIFKICKSSVGNAVGNSVGNAAGNAVGNLVGNGWGNDAVFRWFKFTLKPPYSITHGKL